MILLKEILIFIYQLKKSKTDCVLPLVCIIGNKTNVSKARNGPAVQF